MEKLWILYKQAALNNGPKMLYWANICGIDAKVFCLQNFTLKNNELFYENQIIEKLPKIVLIRGNNFELVDYFEKNNVRVINSNYTIQICRDKWLSYNEVLKLGIPQPKTILFQKNDYDYYKKIFGDKFIIKNRYGQGGANVYLTQNLEEFLAVVNIIKDFNDYIVQEYISPSNGRDLRAYIVGNKIMGFVLRENKTSFRANVDQGGTATTVTNLQELLGENINEQIFKQNILKIAKAVRGEIVTVDFLFGEKSMLLCELNSTGDFLSLSSNLMREEMMMYIKSLL